MKIDTIICGDCIVETEKLVDKSINLTILDPPYCSGARRDAEKSVRGKMLRGDKFEWFSHDNMTTNGFQWFLRNLFIALRPKLVEGAHFYVFCDWRQYPILSAILESAGYRVNDLIVWDKKHFGMGSHYRNQHELIVFASNGKPRNLNSKDKSNIIRYSTVTIKKRIHPTEKPTSVLRYLIRSSSNKGDLVYDPMCGSGSTLLSAHQLRRHYLGVDLNPDYVKMARGRIQSTPTPLESLVSSIDQEGI
ncbi:hypothetical protein LCGC14_1465850 [marine sediment metagenome]|uniref:DNA methylase N-4/N-6 domain-containing protein n=1 Tax=marine sediment metagenome TaxID=412755 RepID=A0A0F9MFQ1_9ZZZZ